MPELEAQCDYEDFEDDVNDMLGLQDSLWQIQLSSFDSKKSVSHQSHYTYQRESLKQDFVNEKQARRKLDKPIACGGRSL